MKDRDFTAGVAHTAKRTSSFDAFRHGMHSLVEAGGRAAALGERDEPFILSANNDRDEGQAFIMRWGWPAIERVAADEWPGNAHRRITHQISGRTRSQSAPTISTNATPIKSGTTLASAATTFTHHRQQITYTQQTVLRPTLVNQFQMLFDTNASRRRA